MANRCVITIGNFDGVHLGHQMIVDHALRLAQAENLPVLALTFEPHPAVILRPGTQPERLTTPEEKIAALREAGADVVEMLEPTQQLLSLSPLEFVKQLVERYQPAALVEGHTFRFGKNREGDVSRLAQWGRELGFEVLIVEPVQVMLDDRLLAPVSSSFVRWLLGQGRVSDAARCLSRPYALTGKVIAGDKRGRTLGVPTANLDSQLLAGRVVPGQGVYAGVAEVPGGATYPAAISVGSKPTFAGSNLTVEAHLLGFSGDLYDQSIRLTFRRWLRDQMPFPGIESLKSQLERDLAQTRCLYDAGVLTGSVLVDPPAQAG